MVMSKLEQIQVQEHIQVQEEKTDEKVQHKLSQVFLNATEKQCTSYFCKEYEGSGEKEYCALGIGLLYYGHKF